MTKITRTETRALGWVNRLRKAEGRKPLKNLKRGIKNDCDQCPLARSLGYCIADLLDSRETPFYVREFTQAFDNGRYPHLEAR